MHHFSCSIYQDFFRTYLHLMGTALEILQHKTQDTFSPMPIKCSLTNLYLILIHSCHAWAGGECIIWLFMIVFKRNVTSTF